MKYVAFIRNVMIGRKGLTQTVLLDAFKHCGATNATSFLSTGNVAFEPLDQTRDKFLTCVTAALLAAVNLTEPIFLRSRDELKRMKSLDPFAQAPGDDIYERCVTFLPNAFLVLPPLPISSARHDVEIFSVVGSEAYSVTRMIGGKSGYAGVLIEKLANVKVTTRNWNTIERLLNKLT